MAALSLCCIKLALNGEHKFVGVEVLDRFFLDGDG